MEKIVTSLPVNVQDALNGAKADFGKIEALSTIMMPQLESISEAFTKLQGEGAENATIAKGLMWMVKDINDTARLILNDLSNLNGRQYDLRGAA